MSITVKHREGSTRHLPEYGNWDHMIQRCTNSNNIAYHHYGGRGITVCDRWRKSFKLFLLDMGSKPSPRHSLERINNDKGYLPGNVRWATQHEQLLNQRKRSDNKSGYKGVHPYKGTQWEAQIASYGVKVFVGHFTDKEQAALAYDCAAIQLHGKYAKLNLL